MPVLHECRATCMCSLRRTQYTVAMTSMAKAQPTQKSSSAKASSAKSSSAPLRSSSDISASTGSCSK